MKSVHTITDSELEEYRELKIDFDGRLERETEEMNKALKSGRMIFMAIIAILFFTASIITYMIINAIYKGCVP